MKNKILLLAALSLSSFTFTAAAQATDLADDADATVSMSSGLNPAALLDNDNSTTVAFPTASYIVWQTALPYTVETYTLTPGADTGRPRAWRLEGSDDGQVWAQIDSKSAQSTSKGTLRTVSIAASAQKTCRWFRFTVDAVTGGGDLCNLAEIHLYGTPCVPPAAPSDIRAKACDTGVAVAWRDNAADEDGFVLERSVDGSSYTTAGTTAANVTKFTDTNMPAGSAAIYRVKAAKGPASSGYCSTGVVSTGTPADLTEVVAAFGATVSGTTPINGNEDGPKGADGSLFTKYLSTSLPATLTVTLPQAVAVTRYSVSSANDAAERDPRDWTFEASANGSDWTVLDTKGGQYFGSRFQTNHYQLVNSTAYKHYRLRITANRGTNLTQLSELRLYSPVEAPVRDLTLNPPTDLRANVRTYNQIELSWTDNNDAEDAYLIERSTDGQNWTRRYTTQPNDKRCYPYALKPNTTYYFRIAPVRGETTGEWSAPITATTPGDEWPETWPNFNFDGGYHTGNLVKKYSNDDIAIFVNPADVNAEGVSMTELDLSWMITPYTEMWKAIRETYYDDYGELLVSDPKLYIVPHYHVDGGGLGRLFQYRDADQLFRNIVHISVGKNSGWRWENNPGNGSTNFLYDVLTHECGHIIEGIGSGLKNSPFYPVWLDSKWAEIFQYDIFGKMDPAHQQVWHKEYMTLGKHTEQKPAPGSEWYAKWLYPTYRDFGGEQLFQRFFALLGKYYFQRDGELQGNGTLGEYIHFWSGGAGYDLTEYAKDAFGWNPEFEMQLMEARARYPQVTYQSPSAYGNLLVRPEALLTASAPATSTLGNINDGATNTLFDSGTKKTDTEWVEITYRPEGLAAMVDAFSITVGSNKTGRPAAIELLGSDDAATWTELYSNSAPEYDANSLFSASLTGAATHTYFKLRLKAQKSNYVSLSVAEYALMGETIASAPHTLAANWTGSAVELSWSAPFRGIEQFEIERSTDGGETFANIATLDVMELAYTDSDTEAGNRYHYRLRSLGADHASPYSPVLAVETSTGGLQSIATDASSIAALLDAYPANRVAVYTPDGCLRHCATMSGAAYTALVQGGASLAKGVYIVAVDFGPEAAQAPIRTKIIVK